MICVDRGYKDGDVKYQFNPASHNCRIDQSLTISLYKTIVVRSSILNAYWFSKGIVGTLGCTYVLRYSVANMVIHRNHLPQTVM